MTDQTYSVPGISCDHCATAIRAAAGDVAGVRAVTVDVPGKLVRVAGDGDAAAVRAAIAEAGYEAA
jgi:copper chaperone